ncbi:uncharacterized protein LODBEIA_P32100 [Lodderomyces beijingensis]|uniref:Protein kinase domain-containing protein n=1 Tax=Lodderomyces beijingensis TaxID=1775926 RepID=A0ABP0ZPZ1_9ASCO
MSTTTSGRKNSSHHQLDERVSASNSQNNIHEKNDGKIHTKAREKETHELGAGQQNSGPPTSSSLSSDKDQDQDQLDNSVAGARFDPTPSKGNRGQDQHVTDTRHQMSPRPDYTPSRKPSSEQFAPAPIPSSPGDGRPMQNSKPTSYEGILKFPIESSHSYSYAHLSPNSLALRLNVLKRCLEILKDRPDLFKSITTSESIAYDDDCSIISSSSQDAVAVEEPSRPTTTDFYAHPNHSVDLIHDVSSPATSFDKQNKKYKLESNASSAALAALFRPPLPRSDSLPMDQNLGSRKVSAPPILQESSVTANQSLAKHNFRDVLNLLETDMESVMTNSEIASTLHDLSLSSQSDDHKTKHDMLKKKLIYALAMPFLETTIPTSSLLQIEDDGASLKSAQSAPSSTALNLLNTKSLASTTTNSNNNGKKRPFQSMLTTKYSAPQSVFTIESDIPWSVKAANDLACLMFGISKTTIKALTLMDLIAPQFRDFVMSRLTGYNLDNGREDNILFAGEIVAIVRPGDRNFSWTSIWAKKKGELIILMFDQVPCDAFNINITKGADNSNTFSIDLLQEVAGNMVQENQLNRLTELSSLSQSLSDELSSFSEKLSGHEDQGLEDSEFINRTRYFTLQLENGEENVPCAITSSSLPLDEDNKFGGIKLKIHTMPYIAGIFVLDAKNFHILSCNNAIARNLFGRSSSELKHRSITELLPKFTEILNAGLEKNADSFQLSEGLVLPEHFFRKYDAVLKYNASQSHSDSSEEDLFLKSHGIEGLHRDGKTIFVDVQARASSQDALILWVTYSRARRERNLSRELDKLSSSTSSISLASSDKSQITLSSRTRSYSGYLKVSDIKQPLTPKRANNTHVSSTYPSSIGGGGGGDGGAAAGGLPSQMKLFNDEKENDLLEFSPREITRSSSTRRVGSASSWMPRGSLDSFMFADSMEPEKHAHKSQSELMKLKTNSPFYSEEEILKIENCSLAEIQAKSPKWPTEVGSARRTKKFSEFTVVKEMGEGAYGKVVLAQHKEDPIYRVIIKCIDKEKILVDTWVRDRRLGTIPSEIQIMAFLNSAPHPNIMRIVDFFEDSKYYYLEAPIFGDPPAIDLFDYIEVRKDLSEFDCRFIFKQAVSSIYHLHKQGIVHRDIKDENVIVDENGLIKLIDFGSAGYVKQGPFDVFVGTIDYASPEVLRGEKYEGKPQDIWALGILLYTMLYKENPFYNVDEIMEGDLRIPYVVSDASLALIQRILVRDISKRPTISDILESEWLQI